MASTPFYTFKKASKLEQAGVYLVGFEFDGTACFRKGSALAPNIVREISTGMESFSPYLNRDLMHLNLFDLGNLSLLQSTDVERQWRSGVLEFEKLVSQIDLKKLAAKIITIGGEHSISYAPIKKYLDNYPDLLIIHLDAHADLRDGYQGFHYSHACIIKRVLDHFTNKNQLIQYGVRSGTGEEFSWMYRHNTLAKTRAEFIERIIAIQADRPIYLTLDLDYFDPSFMPGTGTPEAGGEDFPSLIHLLQILKNKNFVGADIVELAPAIDASGNSSIFAATVIREVTLTLGGHDE